MRFQDARTESAWISLRLFEHQRLVKARAIAVEAAWRDLPINEQSRYFEWAYDALATEDKERTN